MLMAVESMRLPAAQLGHHPVNTVSDFSSNWFRRMEPLIGGSQMPQKVRRG
jgi:hypothetical protein